MQEQIKKPFLTKEQIRFGIEKFKSLDYSTKEGKQCLIDGFINAIYLYDDKITFTFNYKDGTQTVSLAELETVSGSDMKLLGAPADSAGARNGLDWINPNFITKRWGSDLSSFAALQNENAAGTHEIMMS